MGRILGVFGKDMDSKWRLHPQGVEFYSCRLALDNQLPSKLNVLFYL